MKYIFYIIGLSFLMLLLFSLYLIKGLLFNKLKTSEYLENYDLKVLGKKLYTEITHWFNNVQKEYLFFISDFGYKISYYKIRNSSDKFIIISHGVTTNKEYMKKYAYLYTNMGYSVIALDHRYHGESEGKYITYGYFEKHDIKKLVNIIKEQYGNNITIGIHGESMGAGILLSYATLVEDGCDFYIADCSYSDFYELILNKIKKTLKLPKFLNIILLNFTNILTKIFFNFNLKNINIKANINKVSSPILFLNTDDDDYIPMYMTDELYKKSNGSNKEIHIFDGGGHAGSFDNHPKEYTDTVVTFIEKYIDKK